ncbi:MAG: hypothetical protein AAF587_43715 [Bacteroidota bacterium]
MDVQFLTVVKYDSERQVYQWEGRQPLVRERTSFNRIKKAVKNAAMLSTAFFERIRITDLDVMLDAYHPVIAGFDQDGGILWIHEAFVWKSVPQFTLDELTSIFLHEAAHYLEAHFPVELERMFAGDPIWNEIIIRYPEIMIHENRISETKADIYALQRGGKCLVPALDKEHKHVCDYVGIRYSRGYFPERDTHVSLTKRLEILNYYWKRWEAMAAAFLPRMSLRAERKDEEEYHTARSTSDEETSIDGRRAYFEQVLKSNQGYDFLDYLLKLHPSIEILPHWHNIQVDTGDDKERHKEVERFIHDVTTLMRLLLGSANHYVNRRGGFRNDTLPYGAVRANRASLTRVALHEKGSIRRIQAELKGCGLDENVLDELITKLDKLHNFIRFPSFEQQREDIPDLTKVSKSVKSTKVRE